MTENLPSLLPVLSDWLTGAQRVQGATEGPRVLAWPGLVWPGRPKYSWEKGLTDPGAGAWTLCPAERERERGPLGASPLLSTYKVGSEQERFIFFILQTPNRSSVKSAFKHYTLFSIKEILFVFESLNDSYFPISLLLKCFYQQTGTEKQMYI